MKHTLARLPLLSVFIAALLCANMALAAPKPAPAVKSDIIDEFFEEFIVTPPEKIDELLKRTAEKIKKMSPEEREQLTRNLKARLKSRLETFNRDREEIHKEYENLGLKDIPDTDKDTPPSPRTMR